jgi:hypothetical protein
VVAPPRQAIGGDHAVSLFTGGNAGTSAKQNVPQGTPAHHRVLAQWDHRPERRALSHPCAALRSPRPRVRQLRGRHGGDLGAVGLRVPASWSHAKRPVAAGPGCGGHLIGRVCRQGAPPPAPQRPAELAQYETLLLLVSAPKMAVMPRGEILPHAPRQRHGRRLLPRPVLECPKAQCVSQSLRFPRRAATPSLSGRSSADARKANFRQISIVSS